MAAGKRGSSSKHAIHVRDAGGGSVIEPTLLMAIAHSTIYEHIWMEKGKAALFQMEGEGKGVAANMPYVSWKEIQLPRPTK